ncbi:MAG: signal peptidase I [Bdellovibrionales bacterium]|nr:signal peptidase I [Bdellovibrionales bacterium]
MKKSKKATLKGSFLWLFFSILAFLTIRWAFVEPFVIPSGSMIPNLLIHDHIFVNKMAYGLRWPFSKEWLTDIQEPKRGDVVVFRSLDEDSFYMVKRVLGLPGEQIEITDEGNIIINQKPLLRNNIKDPDVDVEIQKYDELDLQENINQIDFHREHFSDKKVLVMNSKDSFSAGAGHFQVPEGHIFLMGDNRDNSRDSRFWGVLPLTHLIGKAKIIWLSCQKTLVSAPFLCDPTSIRWKRFLHTVN